MWKACEKRSGLQRRIRIRNVDRKYVKCHTRDPLSNLVFARQFNRYIETSQRGEEREEEEEGEKNWKVFVHCSRP